MLVSFRPWVYNVHAAAQEGGETATHTIQVADRLCKVLRPHQREGVQFVFECGA